MVDGDTRFAASPDRLPLAARASSRPGSSPCHDLQRVLFALVLTSTRPPRTMPVGRPP